MKEAALGPEFYRASRDERDFRYIFDPAYVYCSDFPGQAFRVLKEKEIARFGEYRTKRLVLEAWKRLPTWLMV